MDLKFREIAYFGGVSSWEKIVCHDASTTLVKVIRKLVSWERLVNIGDIEYKKKIYIKSNSLSTLPGCIRLEGECMGWEKEG